MKRHVTKPKAIRTHKGGKNNIKRSRHQFTNDQANKPVQEPDIVLDIPELKLEELNIKARKLLAEVSVNTKLREMVTMNIGVEARIDSLDIGMRDVRTEAHLRFRLKRVRGILNKTAHTFGKNIKNLRTHNINQPSQEQLRRSNEEGLNKTEIEEVIEKRITKSYKKDATESHENR